MMNTNVIIQRATTDEAQKVAVMVGELLNEIMNTIGIQAFNFDLNETTARRKSFIEQEKYFVFVAKVGHEDPVGFIALYESYALYAEGSFGTIPELYVRPEYRLKSVGFSLISQAKSFGKSHGWKVWKLQRRRFRSLTKHWHFMNEKSLLSLVAVN